MKPPEHFNGMTGEGELNPGFEDENRRKISIVSNDRERKVSSISMPKSILVNGDNLSHLSHVGGSVSQKSVGGEDKEGSSRLLESTPPGYNSLTTEPSTSASPGTKTNPKEKDEKQAHLLQAPDSEESIGGEGKEGKLESSLFVKGYNSLAARPSQLKGTRFTTVGGSVSQKSVGGEDKEGSSRLLESTPPGYNSLTTEPSTSASPGTKTNPKEKDEKQAHLLQVPGEPIERKISSGILKTSRFGYKSLESESPPSSPSSSYISEKKVGRRTHFLLAPDSEESIGGEGKEGKLESSLFVKGYNSLAARPSQLKGTRFTTEHGRVSLPSEHPASFAYPGEEDHLGNSWWYILCTKCRQKETGPGWEPSFWQSVCPYPFCPTYRHVARVFALLLLVLLAWGVIYSIMGQDSAPGGQLFDIAFLCICGHIGGWIFRMIALPPLVGMLLVGIVFRNVGFIDIHGPYNEMVSVLRKIALVNILIRAGLDLDSDAMKRLWLTVLKIGLLPWILECGVLVVLTHYFLGLPWMWGLLLGSIVAAVSPAVVVPCLFRLRNKGYGVAKGIPSLIIAISGIDDAASVAAFGIITSIMFSSNSLYLEVLLGLLSIGIGILFGILWGVLASYVPEKDDPFVVPLRILILLGGGMIAVLGSDLVGLGGAGPLGCIAAAFLSVYAWTKQGWDVEDNPVATAFEIFWMIFEPILFALTGTQIKISEMDPSITGIGIAILVGAFILRIMLTIVVAFGASLNLKEKIFCGLSLMAKASVQAALGPIAVDIVRDKEGPEPGYAHTVALICVMSILLAAPVGSILIILTGSKLLTKTEVPMIPDGWRRSARPSLRDISIVEDFRDNDSFRAHRPSIITEEPKFP